MGVWYVGGRGGAGAVAGDAASADGIVDDTRAPASGTCYFKSTDGHCNNWSFSATRLNLHVAEAAAKHGGCVIVDATRSTTKRFPDSFSKTVPTWAEVLNRAVVRARAATAAHRDDDHDGDHDGDARARWTDGPHLPPWVAENERRRIRNASPVSEPARLRRPGHLPTRRQSRRTPPMRLSRGDARSPASGTGGGRPRRRLGLSDVHPAGAPLRLDAPAVARRAAKQRRGIPTRTYPAPGTTGRPGRGIDAEAFWARRREIIGAGPAGCVGAVDRITRGPVHKRNGRGGGGRVAGGPRGTLDTVGEVLGGMGPVPGPGRRTRRTSPRGAVAGGASGGGGEGRRGGGGALDGGVRWLEMVTARPGLPTRVPSGCRLERGVELGASRRGAGFGGALARPETWDAFDAVLYWATSRRRSRRGSNPPAGIETGTSASPRRI